MIDIRDGAAAADKIRFHETQIILFIETKLIFSGPLYILDV